MREADILYRKNELIKSLLDMKSCQYPFIFQDIDYEYKNEVLSNKEKLNNNFGLLKGSCGVMLTLLEYLEERNLSLSKIFLLSEVDKK